MTHALRGVVKSTTKARVTTRRNRASGRKSTGSPPLARVLANLPKAAPEFVEPMKCRLVEALPEGKNWAYEIKFDGFRGLAVKNGREVQLLSRNRRELGTRFPCVVHALRNLPCAQLVLDGELVALDEQGRSSFQLLQTGGEGHSAAGGLFYYVFDLLNVNGRDTTGLPLLERKALLRTLVGGKSDCLRLSEVLQGSAAELSAMMQPMGLEGLIAKQIDSKYEPGARGGSWVKFKWAAEQEFVIGGYTDPEGSRPYFGSVLVGYYQGSSLHFAAKVGTGFNVKSLKSLYDRFQNMRQEICPFTNLPERGGVIGPSQMRVCKWVRPELVCQVRFTEWTRDGHLRQPVFLGLREDKAAREVIRERADSPRE